MWWQWCMGFIGVCVVLFTVLAAFFLGVRAGQGQKMQLREKPLPRPEYNDPKANRLLREAERKAESEKAVHFTERS